AIDPDELQVTAYVQLDAPAGLVGVPALDVFCDDRCDLHPIFGNQVLSCADDPVVDLVAQVGVVSEGLADMHHGVGDACSQRRRGIVDRLQNDPLGRTPRGLGGPGDLV